MASKCQRRRERRGVQDQTNAWLIRPNMATGRRPSLVVGRSPVVSEFRESPGDFRKAVFSGIMGWMCFLNSDDVVAVPDAILMQTRAMLPFWIENKILANTGVKIGYVIGI